MSAMRSAQQQHMEPILCLGVLALQGAFKEHMASLERLRDKLKASRKKKDTTTTTATTSNVTEFDLIFREVRTKEDLYIYQEEGKRKGEEGSKKFIDGLILPGGESTAMSIIGERDGILDTIKEMYMEEEDLDTDKEMGETGKLPKVRKIPIWGTCAGMILLCNHIMMSKQGGQSVLGGLEALCIRNYFGSQVSSAILPIEITKKMKKDFTAKDSIHASDATEEVQESSIEKKVLLSPLPKPSVFIRAPAIMHVQDPTIDILATVQANPSSSTRKNMIKYLETYDGKTYLPYSESIDALGREVDKTKYSSNHAGIKDNDHTKEDNNQGISLTASSSSSSITTNTTTSLLYTSMASETEEGESNKTNTGQLPAYLTSLLQDLKRIERKESLNSSIFLPNSGEEEQESEDVTQLEPIVAIRRKNILATAFHPELTDDLYWHEYFLQMVIKSTEIVTSN